MRSSRRTLLGVIGPLLLQGCATVSMQDILRSSDSRLVMPSPSIRVPFRDTALALHFSMSATRIGETSRELRIHTSESGSKPDSVAMADPMSRGISLVRNEPFVAAMEASVQLPNQFRAGFGLERSRRESNYRLEVGKAFGDAWPLEAFVSIGNATVTSRTRWTVKTQTTDGWTSITDSSSSDTSIVPNRLQLCYRLGAHWGQRSGGPWVETEVGTVNLFDSPRTIDSWVLTTAQVGIGWMQRTKFGDWTAFLRGTNLGAGWFPTAGIQWNGEMKLGR